MSKNNKRLIIKEKPKSARELLDELLEISKNQNYDELMDFAKKIGAYIPDKNEYRENIIF